MKTPAPNRPAPAGNAGWLPTPASLPRAVDLSHWLSRAARGHSWNAAQRRHRGVHA
jgi:hypothetical protein